MHRFYFGTWFEITVVTKNFYLGKRELSSGNILRIVVSMIVTVHICKQWSAYVQE